MTGQYPADVLRDLAEYWPADLVHDGDLAAINAPIDVLGVNYYTTNVFRAGEVAAGPTPHVSAPDAVQVLRDLPLTEMGWEVTPEGLRELLNRLHREYTGPAGVPLVITENGVAFDDQPDADGFVDDTADRVDYLRRHLKAVHDAIGDGVPVQGYLAWSLMDNFEWAKGYDKRFGIIAVDENLRRIPKASAGWYGRVARTHQLSD